MREGTLDALRVIRDRLNLQDPPIGHAWALIETFCAVSVRVLAKTNTRRVRDEMRTVEILARVNNRDVVLE